MNTTQVLPAILFAGFISASLQGQNSHSIEYAAQKRLITYTGSVEYLTSKQKLKLEVKNKTRDTVVFHIDPGQLFQPADPSYQPLMATRKKEIRLAPGEERPVFVNALCANSPLKSAGTGSTTFKIAGQGDVRLAKLLTTIQENRWEENVDPQRIIWSFTNNHSIAGLRIEGLDEDSKQRLKTTIAFMLKTEVPWYSIVYRDPEPNSDVLFSGIAEHISGNIEYELQEKQDIRIVVMDEHGTVLKTLMCIGGQVPGKYTLPVSFSAPDFPQGQYKIVVAGQNLGEFGEFDFKI